MIVVCGKIVILVSPIVMMIPKLKLAAYGLGRARFQGVVERVVNFRMPHPSE